MDTLKKLFNHFNLVWLTCNALVNRILLFLSVANSISHFLAFAELKGNEQNIYIIQFNIYKTLTHLCANANLSLSFSYLSCCSAGSDVSITPTPPGKLLVPDIDLEALVGTPTADPISLPVFELFIVTTFLWDGLSILACGTWNEYGSCDPVGGSIFESFCKSFDSFCVIIDDFDIMGDVFADVIGVFTELPFAAVLARAFFVASLTSWNFSTN